MSSFFEAGDRFFERLKLHNPRFQLADMTDEQTHTSHALFCVLFFGGGAVFVAAAVLALLSLWSGIRILNAWVFTTPFAIGLLTGSTFYLLREIKARLELGFGYKRWDGAGDVLMPWTWSLPLALAILFGYVPWWCGALLLALAGAIALLYFVFRPLPPKGSASRATSA